MNNQPPLNPFAEIGIEMPLLQSLLALAHSGRTSWHMPGHRAGQDFPKWLKIMLADIDVTELPETDDINKPEGPAREAMAMAAAAFGSGLTRFITSGSTVAMQILLALCPGRGGRLLLPRFVHQSIIHAAAMLDLELSWIVPHSEPSKTNRFGLLPAITASDVAKAIKQNPGCQAILLTSPDYYGTCADLPAIARLVHQHGLVLLVDEAHGAHLSFAPDQLPAGAMQAGADACVQSGHKTLPVLTPGSYIHLSRSALADGRLVAENLDRLIPIFQTSSPSFPIAATLDYARAWLQKEGRVWIGRQLHNLMNFSANLPMTLCCSPATAAADMVATRALRDPLRLVITSQPNASLPVAAGQLSAFLRQNGIDIEFSDLTRLVLIPSLRQPESDWLALAALLQTADIKFESSKVFELEDEWRHWLTTPANPAVSLRETLFSQRQPRMVSLKDSAGAISARAILPYPPGIPLILPGEQIDAGRVDFLRQLLDNKVNINGIDQEKLWVFP